MSESPVSSYMGVKEVRAFPQERDGQPGYTVQYADGYESWSPKEVFENAYYPLDSSSGEGKITPEMVDAFIASIEIATMGVKTTVVKATLVNGFVLVESSSCVDPANYNEALGASICMKRIKDQVWYLLGFVLQWARSGLPLAGHPTTVGPTTID